MDQPKRWVKNVILKNYTWKWKLKLG